MYRHIHVAYISCLCVCVRVYIFLSVYVRIQSRSYTYNSLTYEWLCYGQERLANQRKQFKEGVGLSINVRFLVYQSFLVWSNQTGRFHSHQVPVRPFTLNSQLSTHSCVYLFQPFHINPHCCLSTNIFPPHPLQSTVSPVSAFAKCWKELSEWGVGGGSNEFWNNTIKHLKNGCTFFLIWYFESLFHYSSIVKKTFILSLKLKVMKGLSH